MNQEIQTTMHDPEAAAAYQDRMNTLLSFGCHRTWKRLAAELLRDSAPASGGRALDLCCGTGDLSFLLSEGGRFSVVVGVDRAEAMLQAAKVRSIARESQGTRAPVFIPGNALRLPFADEELDAAAVALGLNEVGDRAQALAELYRVMRPGAVLAVVECCRPAGTLARLAVRLQFSAAAGLVLGGSRQECRLLREGLERAPAPESLLEDMLAAGFRETRMRRFLFGGGVMLWGVKPRESAGDRATCA